MADETRAVRNYRARVLRALRKLAVDMKREVGGDPEGEFELTGISMAADAVVGVPVKVKR